jgi:hypothetical protein
MPALTPIFFYDEQIRRFLLQFARIFSNFQVEYGRNEEGTDHTLVRVPVRYGDATRQAQTILQENSASGMPATPLMTFYISGLDYDRPRIQEPYFVSKINVRQRTYDDATDSYETTQGNAFTIERLMPVPYKLTLKLDIWTSNTNQKMQILEQMLVLFNPSLEIQGTDNYIDWTSLSIVELESTQWTSRTIPQGTENPIDIATLTFTLPIWISSPAKVKKLGVVERIIANVFNAQGDASNAVLDNDLLLGTRQVITPYSYQVLLIGTANDPPSYKLQVIKQSAVALPSDTNLEPTITILTSVPNVNSVPPGDAQVYLDTGFPDALPGSGVIDDVTGNVWVYEGSLWQNFGNLEIDTENLMWQAVVGMYGVLRPGISYVQLEQEDGSEVVGTVSYDPTDDRFLLIDIDQDTVPANTLEPVNAVINPLLSGPDEGLSPPTLGQRYLLTESTGSYDSVASPTAWQGLASQTLVANANDIIEYTGTQWVVSFDSNSSPNNIQYVTNITTGIQYKWIGNSWIKSYQGLYPGGTWSLVV